MSAVVALMIVGVLIVLVYDYTNGLQDAANMLATIVASRATTPIQAAILVSFFTFLGPILGGTAVANTIGNFVDVTDLETVASLTIVLAGLQDGLGYLNDVAAADTLLRDLALTGGDRTPPAWVHAGGLTVGWHRHAAIAAKDRLVEDMAAFLRAKPFWRGA